MRAPGILAWIYLFASICMAVPGVLRLEARRSLSDSSPAGDPTHAAHVATDTVISSAITTHLARRAGVKGQVKRQNSASTSANPPASLTTSLFAFSTLNSCTCTYIPTSVSSTSTSTSSTSTATPEPTAPLTCNSTAYLIGALPNAPPTLYNIDLATSNYFAVNNNVGGGAYASINAIGYNVLDDYIYGVGNVAGTTNAVLQISATGNTREISRFTQNEAPAAGDIDTDGQLWLFSEGGTQWRRVDLAPGSPTYGQTIETGTSTLVDYYVVDLVYLPGQGDYLYSMSSAGGSQPRIGIVRWSRTTHTWSEFQFTSVTTAPDSINANWGSNNGTIWGFDGTAGVVYRQVLGGTLTTVGTAPGGLSYIDGARCAITTT